MKYLLSYFFLFFYSSPFFSQGNREKIIIPYSSCSIEVDGNLDDWEIYAEYFFSDTLNSFISETSYELEKIYPSDFDFKKLKLPRSRNKVCFRTFWNETDLCCAITVWDEHFFAEIHGRIDKPLIHLNDGVELYFDTGNESSRKMDINDYQFLVDIENNTEVFKGDLKEILADTLAVPKDYAQHILFYSAVCKIGKANDEIIDSVYTVEIKIPFASIGIVPYTRKKIGIDVCVNDFDFPSSQTEQIEEVSTGMHPFSWSGYSDFGYPQYWKEAELIGAPTWFEKVSNKYRKEWFWIYILTVIFSLFLIGGLMYRSYELRKLPSAKELQEGMLFMGSNLERLSYNQKILQKAANYIMENKAEHLTSEKLAENLGISLRTFQRITKNEMNVTPTNYIRVIKLKMASEFLKNKSGNVTQASYEFGFSNPSYFSKIFKNHFGYSPSDWIKVIEKNTE
jgi:AraC-like DNA-binding protein